MAGLERCRLCGADGLQKAAHAPGVVVYRCPRCRSGLADYDHEAVEEGFDERYAADLDAQKTDACWQVFTRVIPEPRAGLELLDIGCHRGEFLDRAASAGLRTTGLEPGPGGEIAGLRHRVIRERIETDAVRAGSYDVVTMWDVLEHTRDPGAAISAAIASLRNGGWMIVVTPAMGTVFDRSAIVLARLSGGRERRILDMCWSSEHLTRFDPRGLRAEAQHRGCAQADSRRTLLLSLKRDRYAGGAIMPDWTGRDGLNQVISRWGVTGAQALRLTNKIVLVARRGPAS